MRKQIYRPIKNFTAIGLLFAFLVGLNACCTQKKCTGSEEISEVDFYNFSQADLDNVTIISYVKNTNFGTFAESEIAQASLSGDHFAVYTHYNIGPSYDYKININSTGQVFTLTGFEIRKQDCNSCFPYTPDSDFYNTISAYLINGQKQSGNQIKIYK